MSNIFEQAARLAIRFESIRGSLTTEQLWDLPLTSKSGFDLNSVAKAVNSSLKTDEENFVAVTADPAKAIDELRMAVVKHIIAVRLEENAAAANSAKRAAERQKLLSILEGKKDEALQALSPEEIERRLSELGQ